MPRDRDVWLGRINAVGLEHAAARLAADRLLTVAEHDPTILTRAVKLKDVRRMAERLDGTYVVRLFAEFETALRAYWAAARRTGPDRRPGPVTYWPASRRRAESLTPESGTLTKSGSTATPSSTSGTNRWSRWLFPRPAAACAAS